MRILPKTKRKKKKIEEKEKKISIFVEFSDIKDKEPQSIISKVIKRAKEIGKIVKTRVYFLQDEFQENREVVNTILEYGIEPVIAILAKDVKLAIDLLEDSYSNDIDVIIMVYNQDALLPALIDAKNRKAIFFVKFNDMLPSLETIADEIIEI